jgi:phospholipid/cholesterol/gamma-HCH transport system permease protein
MSPLTKLFTQIGELSLFGVRAVGAVFVPPFEWEYFRMQVQEIGWNSLGLIAAAGFSLGVILTLHTQSILKSFGAEAWSPTLQSASFFNELGPLVTALLISGRVGAGIGAELANMRATEQIDAIETLSVDSFKFLVVTRILACVVALPLLTVWMDFTSLMGGFVSEYFGSHMSFQLYIHSAFKIVGWANFLAPTLKTCVFGFIIGTVSCFYGYTINEGSSGVRRAATSSVVLSSLLVILSDVLLVKTIYFLFPGSAI